MAYNADIGGVAGGQLGGTYPNPTLLNSAVIGKLLTGYVSGPGVITGADSILSAIQKLNGNIGAITSGVSSVFGRTGAVLAVNGDYNTSQVTENTNLYFTNARAIAAPITGYVSGAGVVAATDTILQAIQKLNGNTAALIAGVSSVFGRTGAVVQVSGDYTTAQVTESGNLYYTNARGIGSVLTGYVSGAGTVAAADTILQAIQKLNGNDGLKANLASPTFTGIVTTPNLTLSAFTAGSILFAGTSGAVSQDNASFFFDDTNNRLGLLTAVPTHTITLGSTATGYSAYNTVDQVTNFERVNMAWAGNEFQILTAKGGTGTQRTLSIGCTTSSSIIRFTSSGQIMVALGTGIGSAAGAFQIGAGLTMTGSTAIIAAHTTLFTTITQTVTAGYRMLMISPFENTLGSGPHYLIDAGTNTNNLGNGTHTSKFVVDSTGGVNFAGNFNMATAGSSFIITEGTNGRVGQTTLVAGTKAITITGLTTNSRAFTELVTPTGVALTVTHQAVCTANTLTIQANVAAGTINTADTSVLNYFVIN